MVVRFLSLVVLLMQSHLTQAQACNVSKPNIDDPKGAMRSNKFYGWFGSDKLAALIPHDGQWLSMGEKYSYRNKFWWWHGGYDAGSSSEKILSLTVENLVSGESFIVDDATNARNGSDNYEWNSMLIGMEFPSAGCWKITGNHKDQKLVIIVQVEG